MTDNTARCGCDPGPYSSTIRCETCGTFIWNTHAAWCGCAEGQCSPRTRHIRRALTHLTHAAAAWLERIAPDANACNGEDE